ncbi:PIR Superfamily Protein [Plasmodium ovale wallikeri]|uniref:PIR protein n=2 Tax=Plasmodium ovale TaxID=36330 RepID=A0A1C3KIE7_PLAOA|nr:PIR Superfamily Protein [Plasmodium ovale wallikeri]SBT73558.1 PIR protein [Plasmodium ovale]
MDEWEKTLKHLPSYQSYDMLNNKLTLPYECTYCTDIISFETMYTGITNFCCDMEKILSKLLTLQENSLHKTELCTYFKFWFIHQIWKRFSAHKDTIYNGSLISRLTYIWGQINDDVLNAECPIILHNNIPLDKWKEMKDLHDYFKNYDTIDNDVTSSDKCQNYNKYVTQNSILYENHHNKCCVSPKDNLENYFNCDEKYNPSNLLSKLRCEIYVPESQKDSQVLLPEENAGENTSPISTDTVPVVAGSFTVFTILSSLFIVYKFTPFGPRIINRIFSSRVWSNTEKETGNHELISHIIMDQETELDDKGYTLAYNSL